MRRLLLFAAALGLLGLSTAFAASFTVQSEDIASFSTDVSISVPNTPLTLPGTIYIGGATGDAEGPLLLKEPPNINTENRLVVRDGDDVQPQTDPAAFFTWKTVSAPPGGYLLVGTVTLAIAQNELGTDRMTAGLFECEKTATIDSSTPPVAPPTLGAGECQLIVSAAAVSDPAGGVGYKDRTVMFGAVGPVVIEHDHDLRLKIVNKSDVSTQDWSLSWGYNPARESFLTVVP